LSTRSNLIVMPAPPITLAQLPVTVSVCSSRRR
jgi:hypothetical protein